MSRDDALPVLFLDIDDVLCLNTSYGGYDAELAVNDRHPNPEAVFGKLFALGARRALGQVHELLAGDIRYVISSTWGTSFDREQLVSIFRQSGLGFVASHLQEGEGWRTASPDESSRRVDEIASWLDRYSKDEPFVILDDHHSGASLAPALDLPAHPFAGRVVLCEEWVGLTDEHVALVVSALRRPLQLPSAA